MTLHHETRDDSTDVASVPTPTDSRSLDTTTVLAAGFNGAAAVIHIAMVPLHADAGLTEALGFAAFAWAQIAVAVALVTSKTTRRIHQFGIVVNVMAAALWAWSRTSGLPFGAHRNVAESVGAVDGLAVAFELGAVAASAVFLMGVTRRVGVAGLVGSLAAVALATGAIVSPEAANHGHGGSGTSSINESSAGGHGHGGGGDTDTMAAEMQFIDDSRCDQAFNPVAYWQEAEQAGIDVYAAGAMGSHAATSLTGSVLTPDALGGRGSEQLDVVVALASSSTGSELDAARLVTSLADATDEEYRAFLGWMRNTSGSHGSHDASAPDDAGGHGGHAGPTPWKAMVDQSQCDQLQAELAEARDVALSYPTPVEAEAAGWKMVTPYVPGIAAHYIKYDLVDGVFALDEPEMLLYDGTSPDARIVGLSYYILHDGEAEPTQGFTGGNDHFHRHIGLCNKEGVVIGDSSTTAEECEARGGSKGTRSNGWMSHAWVVPGCESPWGVFSGANPILENGLTEASGSEGTEGCAKSGVRDRYDLTPGSPEVVGIGAASGGSEVAAGDGQ